MRGMQAAVTNDATVRTIRVEVTGVPDIDITMHWHQKAQWFRPNQMLIEMTNGKVGVIRISGGLVKKNGEASDRTRKNKVWYSQGDGDHRDMPEWVKMIANQAVDQGVTSWNL